MRNNNLVAGVPTIEQYPAHREDLCQFEGGWTCYRYELGKPEIGVIAGEPRIIRYHTREWWLVQSHLGQQASLASQFELEPVHMPYEAPAFTVTKPYRKPQWSLKLRTVLEWMVIVTIVTTVGTAAYSVLKPWL